MKTLELSLRKYLLLVELPEGWTWERNYYDDDNSTEIEAYLGDDCVGLKILNVNWNLTCRASELTEEMAGEWVESWESVAKDGTMVYDNYHRKLPMKRTAIESFHSAVGAKGIYFENPFEKPDFFSGDYDDNGFGDVDKRKYKQDLKKFEEAQSRTFNLDRTLIFEKL